ncbi:MAG: ABC transporter permease [bacterium]
MGLALGFDGINGERARGTLSRLLGQPITRDAVINAKYLAGMVVLGLMIFSLGFLVAGLGLIMIGVPPTWEEIGRILIFLLLTVLYMGFWLGLSLLLLQLGTSPIPYPRLAFSLRPVKLHPGEKTPGRGGRPG